MASGLDGVATPAGFALVIGAAAAWGVGNIAIKRASPRLAGRIARRIADVGSQER